MIVNQSVNNSKTSQQSERPGCVYNINNMPTKILFLIISYIVCLQSNAQDNSSWPIFRGSPDLHGIANVQMPKFPKLLWTFKMGDKTKSSPVISAGSIYIGSNNGNIYSISETGKLLWKYNAGTAIEAPPLVVDNTVFVGSLEGALLALDSKTGK